MISALFIRRPVATIMLMAGLVLGGVATYRELPVAALPQADLPTISVSADLTGASPDTMASAVATPLIKQFQTIAGIDTITASSTLGQTSIQLQFDLSRDIDAAAADVQAAIAAATRRLPSGLDSAPSYRKSNPAASPIVLVALSSPTMPVTKVDDIAENVILPALSTLPGVAQARIYGAKTYAVRIEVDPDLLAARGLSLAQVAEAIAAANDRTPVGTIQNASQALTISVDTQRTSAEAFRSLVVARPGGRPVRLGEVADVKDSITNLYQSAMLDGAPSIVVAVQRQPDANTVAVVDAVRAALPGLQASLPRDLSMTIINDSSVAIRAAVTDVQETLGITIGLVILVIYLFLARVYATFIPGLAVPLSLMATVVAMWALGLSIDNISLLGLTLSVGLVVDDAIVMLENIVRRIDQGETPMEAAIHGSREVTGTIISMSLSLVAVFLPIFLMGGVVGRVLNEFGVVVTLAILSSAVVSLTVTPMLAARLPAARGDAESGPSRTVRIYGRMVAYCLRNRAAVMLAFVLLAGASAVLVAQMPRSFFPQEDIGQLRISTQARQDISFAAMSALQARAAEIVRADPAVAHVTSLLGGGPGADGFNAGSMLVELVPRGDRPPLARTLAGLRRALAPVAGLSAFVTPSQTLRFGARSTKSQYQLVVQSLDAAEARDWSGRILGAMRADGATFADPATDLQPDALIADVKVDQDAADGLGIASTALRETLNAAFGGQAVAQIQSTGNSYDVILQLGRGDDLTERDLAMLRVPAADGTLVPLGAFATVSRGTGPVSVNQSGQLTAVTLSFNLPAGVSLGTATAAIDALKDSLGVPASVLTAYGGDAAVFQQASGNTALLIGGAVLVIYIVLGILYESFIHPLTILSGLPSAVLGALLALEFAGFDLSIIALIGILMLIGIVKKNAIMMIDVALDLRRTRGMSAPDAVLEAATMRFRPIMMTTFCALLGVLPVALGTGASSELRQPLGVAVAGGLVVSQVLTLFITPVVFLLLEALSERVLRAFGSAPQVAQERGVLRAVDAPPKPEPERLRA